MPTLTELLAAHDHLTPEGDGLLSDIPLETYLAWDAVSSSRLGALSMSPAHYRAFEEVPKDSTEPQRFGNMIHTAILEPDKLGSFVVEPDFQIRREDGSEYKAVKQTRAYKERRAQWLESLPAGIDVIPAEWRDAATTIQQRAIDHPLLRPLLLDDKHPRFPEESGLFRHAPTDLRCKLRMDMYLPAQRLIVDIKSTRKVLDFEGEIARYRYYRQAAFYTGGLQILTGEPHQFVIVAVENVRPFAIRAAVVADEAIQEGRRQLAELLRTLRDCQQSNHWPGPESPDEWRLPAWAISGG